MEQLDDLSQTRVIACALMFLRKRFNEPVAIGGMIAECMRMIDERGLDVLSDSISGHLARFRGFEPAFALNRLRILKVEQR